MSSYSLTDTKTETLVTTYTRFEILEVRVVPFNSATVTVMLISDYDQRKIFNYSMNTEDYNNWNNDDQFLIDWIKTQIANI